MSLINKMDEKEKRKFLWLQGRIKIEIDIIIVLENYAEKLDNMIDEFDDNFDFNTFFKYIDDLPVDDIKIESLPHYAEYLKGVALCMYNDNIQEEDLLDMIGKDEDLDGILNRIRIETTLEYSNDVKITDWVTLEDNLQCDKDNLNILCSKYIKGEALQYINKSKNKWALLIGMTHYFYLKKIRKEKDE